MELTAKQSAWKVHVEAADVFDGSLADYARLHDLEIKKLYFYKTALREKAMMSGSTSSGFVQVTTNQTMRMSAGIRVMLPNGVQLSLPDMNAPGLLERLARL